MHVGAEDANFFDAVPGRQFVAGMVEQAVGGQAEEEEVEWFHIGRRIGLVVWMTLRTPFKKNNTSSAIPSNIKASPRLMAAQSNALPHHPHCVDGVDQGLGRGVSKMESPLAKSAL